MDAETRAHIRRERDRLVRRKLKGSSRMSIGRRPKHWPALVTLEENEDPFPATLFFTPNSVLEGVT